MTYFLVTVGLIDVVVTGYILSQIVIGRLRFGRIAIATAAYMIFTGILLIRHATTAGLDVVTILLGLIVAYSASKTFAFWPYLLPDRATQRFT